MGWISTEVWMRITFATIRLRRTYLNFCTELLSCSGADDEKILTPSPRLFVLSISFFYYDDNF